MVRNRKVTFLKMSVSCDELGQEKITWQDTGRTALAKISPVSGKLYYEAARTGEENTMLFKIRFSYLPKGFNRIDYRLMYNGVQYRIKQFSDVDELHREVQLRGVSV
ncbi:MAG: phage head closure protein [Ruminococcus sp.]|nr:phage head closure protein [Ruminococcus sp.]